jgi:hypothetical protein
VSPGTGEDDVRLGKRNESIAVLQGVLGPQSVRQILAVRTRGKTGQAASRQEKCDVVRLPVSEDAQRLASQRFTIERRHAGVIGVAKGFVCRACL